MGHFAIWITEHHPPQCLPPPHGILQAIQMAGAAGISRRELSDLFDLDPELLTRLLAAYQSVGWITASRENGQTVYRNA
jgi:hypothetical protein